jgi:lysozyme
MANENMKTGKLGQELIKHYEQGPEGGFAKKRYFCSSGKPTIGWGHVILPNEKAELWDAVIDEAKADAILANDLVKYENIIKKYVKTQLTQNQFDALVSFCLNAGEGDFASSTLLKKVNAGLHDEVSAEFLKWKYGTDPKTKQRIELKGLLYRRQSEQLVYSDGMLKFFNI